MSDARDFEKLRKFVEAAHPSRQFPNMCENEKFDIKRRETLDILNELELERKEALRVIDKLQGGQPGYCPIACGSVALPDLIELELHVVNVTKIDKNAKLVHTGDTVDYEDPPEEAINWPALQLRCRNCGWQWELPEGYTVEPL